MLHTDTGVTINKSSFRNGKQKRRKFFTTKFYNSFYIGPMDYVTSKFCFDITIILLFNCSTSRSHMHSVTPL